MATLTLSAPFSPHTAWSKALCTGRNCIGDCAGAERQLVADGFDLTAPDPRTGIAVWAGLSPVSRVGAAGHRPAVRGCGRLEPADPVAGGVGGHADVLTTADAAGCAGVKRLVFAHIGRSTLRVLARGTGQRSARSPAPGSTLSSHEERRRAARPDVFLRERAGQLSARTVRAGSPPASSRPSGPGSCRSRTAFRRRQDGARSLSPRTPLRRT
jgi:hypothetical protein